VKANCYSNKPFFFQEILGGSGSPEFYVGGASRFDVQQGELGKTGMSFFDLGYYIFRELYGVKVNVLGLLIEISVGVQILARAEIWFEISAPPVPPSKLNYEEHRCKNVDLKNENVKTCVFMKK